MTTPTPEELCRHGLILAAIRYGVQVAWYDHSRFILVPRNKTEEAAYERARLTHITWLQQEGAFMAAAKALGLTPVSLGGVPADMVLVPAADVQEAAITTGYAIIYANQTVAEAGTDCDLGRRFESNARKWGWLQDALKRALSSSSPKEAKVEDNQGIAKSLGYVIGQLRYIRARHPDDPAWGAIFNNISFDLQPYVDRHLSEPPPEEVPEP
ncbi:MAG TPA: hypothetical protein VGK74_02870 [Symbiobacteriaceae bacterium]